jgi:hypothetical protein
MDPNGNDELIFCVRCGAPNRIPKKAVVPGYYIHCQQCNSELNVRFILMFLSLVRDLILAVDSLPAPLAAEIRYTALLAAFPEEAMDIPREGRFDNPAPIIADSSALYLLCSGLLYGDPLVSRESLSEDFLVYGLASATLALYEIDPPDPAPKKLTLIRKALGRFADPEQMIWKSPDATTEEVTNG